MLCMEEQFNQILPSFFSRKLRLPTWINESRLPEMPIFIRRNMPCSSHGSFMGEEILYLLLKLVQNWFVLGGLLRFLAVTNFNFFYMGLVWNLKCIDGSPSATPLHLNFLFLFFPSATL